MNPQDFPTGFGQKRWILVEKTSPRHILPEKSGLGKMGSVHFFVTKFVGRWILDVLVPILLELYPSEPEAMNRWLRGLWCGNPQGWEDTSHPPKKNTKHPRKFFCRKLKYKKNWCFFWFIVWTFMCNNMVFIFWWNELESSSWYKQFSRQFIASRGHLKMWLIQV